MNKDALIEFETLQENEVYTISIIKDWLLEYVGHYEELKSNWQCPNKACSYRSTKQCSCDTKADEYIFISLFSTLLYFSKYHHKERYAELELEAYQKIKNNKESVIKWVRKNEYVGTKECFNLLLCHHDYDLNPYHLLVMGKSLLGYEVFVDRDGFKNLIAFLEIFNELFWVKKVCPESDCL